jgi:predicted nucleotidyltransferase component of viral defense system
MFESANALGFSDEAHARDLCQLQFLAQLMRQGAGRFILKGGMAMRALYRSARLTKDIDFDCEDSVSIQSMRAQIPKALTLAARAASLLQITVKQTKKGDLSNKWRLDARLQGERLLTFDVEISRRGVPGDDYVTHKTVEVPSDYRIAPFVVRVYTDVAMAAGKVNALLSPNRSVPRDVYDLHDFVRAQVDPSNLWATAVPREVLQRKRDLVYAKVDGIRFEHVNAELVPYLTPTARASLTAERWDAMRIEVAERIVQWFEAAIPRAKLAEETRRDPQSDADLAGR